MSTTCLYHKCCMITVFSDITTADQSVSNTVNNTPANHCVSGKPLASPLPSDVVYNNTHNINTEPITDVLSSKIENTFDHALLSTTDNKPEATNQQVIVKPTPLTQSDVNGTNYTQLTSGDISSENNLPIFHNSCDSSTPFNYQTQSSAVVTTPVNNTHSELLDGPMPQFVGHRNGVNASSPNTGTIWYIH